MLHWKLFAPAAILAAGMTLCVTSSYGTADYAKKEKKACTYCHTKTIPDEAAMNKNLTPSGTCYKSNNHSLAKCLPPKKEAE